MKEKSKQRTRRREPAPKQTKIVPSANINYSVGFLGNMYNTNYYAILLQRLGEEMKKKLRYLV